MTKKVTSNTKKKKAKKRVSKYAEKLVIKGTLDEILLIAANSNRPKD
jgi:hypothetical protein